jgi:hypothetical protein
MIDCKRYHQQCEEHILILDLLGWEKNKKASQALRASQTHHCPSPGDQANPGTMSIGVR